MQKLQPKTWFPYNHIWIQAQNTISNIKTSSAKKNLIAQNQMQNKIELCDLKFKITQNKIFEILNL